MLPSSEKNSKQETQLKNSTKLGEAKKTQSTPNMLFGGNNNFQRDRSNTSSGSSDEGDWFSTAGFTGRKSGGSFVGTTPMSDGVPHLNARSFLLGGQHAGMIYHHRLLKKYWTIGPLAAQKLNLIQNLIRIFC